MKVKKRHTLLILIVFLALALLAVLFVTSWITVPFRPDQQGWKTIPEQERKTPTLENVIAFDRATLQDRIRPQDYFTADSLGWLVNKTEYRAPQMWTSLYCGDPENPKGSVPSDGISALSLYDYGFKPLEMYGRSFETRFLISEGVMHGAAYVYRDPSPDGLYSAVRETAGQITRQFTVETSRTAVSALESADSFWQYVDANKKQAEIWHNGIPFTEKQEYSVIGDYVAETFPGTLRITVHIPERGDPYAVFVWQKTDHALLFNDGVCFLNAQYRVENDTYYINTPYPGEDFYEEKHEIEASASRVREANPKNLALDY